MNHGHDALIHLIASIVHGLVPYFKKYYLILIILYIAAILFFIDGLRFGWIEPAEDVKHLFD